MQISAPSSDTGRPSPSCAGDEGHSVDHDHSHQHDHNHSHDHDHDHDHAELSGWGLWFAVIALASLLFAWSISWLPAFIGESTGNAIIVQSLYGSAFLFGGFFAAIDMAKSLMRGRLTIDTLMIAAGIGAAFIGHLPEGALLLVLFSIGHAAEHYAMGRAERSINALGSMRPDTASRIDPATKEVTVVPIAEIHVGDTVLVRPDNRLPVDGIVVDGNSSVDQSPITGESIPVDKSPLSYGGDVWPPPMTVAMDHVVFAGTINGGGSMTIRATRRNDDSTLAKVVRMIAEAKTQRSPTQRLADSFERVFVPIVLALVAILLFAFVVVDEPFSRSLYRAMAVLVAASPCALAIATPAAVLSAVARAGRDGVLIKGGGPLEQLGQVTAVAFDKTGTLTTGRPEVVDVVLMPNITRAELLATAAAVQRLSDHPLARAIVRASDSESHAAAAIDEAVTEVNRVNGRGVSARLGGELVSIGNLKLFSESEANHGPVSQELRHAENELVHQGRTIAIVARENRFLGVIGMVDTLRPAAKTVVENLHAIGIRRVVMLSGDHQNAAMAIANLLTLDDARGDLMPADKVAIVSELSKTNVIAMVGDGANDAPAMAAASVSIAMGAAGSDVALETADIALMGDDLTKLPLAISLGQAGNRVIRQNLVISLGMIVFLVPAAIFGLRLGPAVVLHEGSTIVVVLNALRLLRFRYTPS